MKGRNVFAAAVVLGLAIFMGGVDAQAFKLFGSGDGEVKPVNGMIVIPIKEVSEKAKFYTYKGAGAEIRFFVVKSSDGVIRSAFDACDVCYHAKKGYTQDGDNMVCNNCGMRIPTIMVNKVKGGCNPSPLKHVIEGDELRIEQRDIEEGSRFFS